MYLTSQCQIETFIYCFEMVNRVEVTTWSRAPLEKLTIAQHVNELSVFMKPESSPLRPQDSDTGPHPELAESRPLPHGFVKIRPIILLNLFPKFPSGLFLSESLSRI
jgi:hypothetical protein